MNHTHNATISWDEDAKVWYVSDTDFPGFVAEAGSVNDLIQKVRQLVPELYDLNRHLFDRLPSKTIPLKVTSSRLEMIDLVG